MFGPIPTKGGDVVISYSGTVPTDYLVWLADKDGQQRPAESSGDIRVGTRAEAEEKADGIASDSHGRIFIVDQDSGQWDRVLLRI